MIANSENEDFLFIGKVEGYGEYIMQIPKY